MRKEIVKQRRDRDKEREESQSWKERECGVAIEIQKNCAQRWRNRGRWRNRMVEKELVKRQSCAAAGRAV